MYVFDLATETWTTRKAKIPDGSSQESAAVSDGVGHIWYHGPDNLVEYDPSTESFTEYKHKAFDVYETRVAYDPLGNNILFAGFQNDHFMIFDIDKGSFSESSSNPGGEIKDNTCGDNSGRVYTGAKDYLHMYRYDVASDTWTVLPDLPAEHDNNSTCVVSQDGWLYYGTENTSGFFALPLGTIGP
jgi:streptogramin lyase